MSAHSPGPWTWWNHGADCLASAIPGRQVLTFDASENQVHVSPDDARLIAAAPELLAHLEWALGFIGRLTSGHECAGYCQQYAAQALLARIEGTP